MAEAQRSTVLVVAIAALACFVGLCGADDPWNNVYWETDSSGNFVQNVPDATIAGLSFGEAKCLDVSGHAVVVHSPTGTRVGCGLIASDGSATISAYPGYDTSTDDALVVGGTVQVTASATSANAIQITAFLVNNGGFEAGRQGGLHIHTGTSCDDPDAVGAHFYEMEYESPELEGPDYWTNVQWQTDGAGCMNPDISSLTVRAVYFDPEKIADPNNTTDFNVNGRCAVVHDASGARVGCGVVNDDPWVSATYTTDGSGTTTTAAAVNGFSIFDNAADDDGAYVNAAGVRRIVAVCSVAKSAVACPRCICSSF